MKTKFKIGQKVYLVRNDNIFQFKIVQCNYNYSINKEWEKVNEYYQIERKYSVGLLKTETDNKYDIKKDEIFWTVEEAKEELERVKKGKEEFWNSHLSSYGMTYWIGTAVSAAC